MAKASRSHPVLRIKGGETNKVGDLVVEEGQLSIVLNGRKIVTLACTPREQEYLALGFLFSEGIIRGGDDIRSVLSHPEREEVRVSTKKRLKLPVNLSQSGVVTSGCGRGKSLESLEEIDPVEDLLLNFELRLSPSEILSLMKRFDERSTLFRETGGVHSAALANCQRILLFAEDIGRHNAIDKVLGKSLMRRFRSNDKLILCSGRISSDLLLKVWRAGISFVCSRSAPTGKALDLAERLGVTVVGFARGGRMNLYTYPARIVHD